MPSEEDLKKEIERLRADNEALKCFWQVSLAHFGI